MLANVWFGDGFFSSIFLIVDLTFFTVMQFVSKVGEANEYREHHEYLRAYYCGLNKGDDLDGQCLTFIMYLEDFFSTIVFTRTLGLTVLRQSPLPLEIIIYMK